jgi:hypothetical protein
MDERLRMTFSPFDVHVLQLTKIAAGWKIIILWINGGKMDAP